MLVNEEDTFFGSILNSVQYEDGYIKNDAENKWIFVRLYDSRYNLSLSSVGGGLLSFGQKITRNKNWKVFTNHSAINYKLTDNFFGLSVHDGDASLKIERCQNLDDDDFQYINKRDFNYSKSKYYVFGFKCTPEEYNIMKKKINNAYKNKTVMFDVGFAGGTMTLYSILSKIKQILHVDKILNIGILGIIHKSDSVLNDEDYKRKNGQVNKICSTFVGGVLISSIGYLRDHFEKKENFNKSIFISPSDIASFPRARRLFSGTFDTYNRDLLRFIRKHPDFDEYMK